MWPDRPIKLAVWRTTSLHRSSHTPPRIPVCPYRKLFSRHQIYFSNSRERPVVQSGRRNSMLNRRSFLQAAIGAAAAPAWCAPQDRARPLNLKITGLKTFVVNAGSLNWVFCKIFTNDGLVGLGEGSVTSKEATVAAAIMEHERFLIGKDPSDIEFLWQSMFRVPRWRGGPILNSAISAVEIALWDILGQALGVPIYKLLGGAARN